MIQIENEFLTVVIAEKGAELQSVKGNRTEIEYMWQADPEIWGRHAPVLFPFVGRSKDDQYTYQGQTYPMGQHGFARDKVFSVESHSAEAVTFLLTADAETRAVYPFEFELRLSYQLKDMQLKVGYEVVNPDTKAPLYFSIGGHPGFRVPLTDDTQFEDYFLDYKPQKSRIRIPLQAPYINLAERTLAATDVATDIKRELFKQDAMVYELKCQENIFSIRSEKTKHAISLRVQNAPFIGVWSPYETDAPLVCIEPWWGIADDVNASGELTEKFGVNRLAPQEQFQAGFEVTFS